MLIFKTKGKIFDVAVTGVAGMLSVCVMLYAIAHFGLRESWPELVLNLFYLTCLTMMWIRPTISYGLVACFVSETE